MKIRLLLVALVSLIFLGGLAQAQDVIPYDNGLSTYHTSPNYRESESHPLRILSYVLHPVGWVAREVVFRPLSYFASSSRTRRSVMGYREPFDYRQPECFSKDHNAPDCRSVIPFNYDMPSESATDSMDETEASSQVLVRHVYFPDVNFDFNRHALTDLGKGRARQIARLLNDTPDIKVVLQGHTDYLGSDTYNEKLGLDRAEAVKQELLALGVSTDRVSTVTFGKSQPVFGEQDNWARAVNRRVSVQYGG